MGLHMASLSLPPSWTDLASIRSCRATAAFGRGHWGERLRTDLQAVERLGSRRRDIAIVDILDHRLSIAQQWISHSAAAGSFKSKHIPGLHNHGGLGKQTACSTVTGKGESAFAPLMAAEKAVRTGRASIREGRQNCSPPLDPKFHCDGAPAAILAGPAAIRRKLPAIDYDRGARFHDFDRLILRIYHAASYGVDAVPAVARAAATVDRLDQQITLPALITLERLPADDDGGGASRHPGDDLVGNGLCKGLIKDIDHSRSRLMIALYNRGWENRNDHASFGGDDLDRSV